jgi:hypothetical protein
MQYIYFTNIVILGQCSSSKKYNYFISCSLPQNILKSSPEAPITEQNNEVERRWLLREPPLERIEQFPKITIVQGYAQCQPDELIVQKRTDEGFELVLHVPIPENSLGVKLTSFVPPWIYEHYQNPKNQRKCPYS